MTIIFDFININTHIHMTPHIPTTLGLNIDIKSILHYKTNEISQTVPKTVSGLTQTVLWTSYKGHTSCPSSVTVLLM